MSATATGATRRLDAMRPLDALFLHVEDGISHMHIGSCAVFEGPAPSMAEVLALVEAKLPLLARYRQRVRNVPLQLGHPVWVDDAAFDLGYHVRHTSLPPHGDPADLANLMGRLMSHELDRNRPLWEAWFVEGLPDHRWAIISKVHHCMVDGVAGTDMMRALLDADPGVERPDATTWHPQPAPSNLRLVLDACVGMAVTPGRQLLSWRPLDAARGDARTSTGALMAGLRSLGGELISPTKRVSLEGLIGPQRRWAVGRSSLADIKDIRASAGATVNDVVLAAITGAFRDVLMARHEEVDGVVLRTLVPVSVRSVDDHTANNQVSMCIAELPVGISDPVERLTAIRDEMLRLKSSHQAVAASAVIAAADLVPPALWALGARAVMTVLRRLPQSSVHTVTTNIPGPRQPLYALGREMVEYLPFVPVTEGTRMGVAILTYNGRIAFGVTGDYDTSPDVQLMADRIEQNIVLMRRATTARTQPRKTRKAQKARKP